MSEAIPKSIVRRYFLKVTVCTALARCTHTSVLLFALHQRYLCSKYLVLEARSASKAREHYLPIGGPSKPHQEVAFEYTALWKRLFGKHGGRKKGRSLFFCLCIFHKRKLGFVVLTTPELSREMEFCSIKLWPISRSNSSGLSIDMTRASTRTAGCRGNCSTMSAVPVVFTRVPSTAATRNCRVASTTMPCLAANSGCMSIHGWGSYDEVQPLSQRTRASWSDTRAAVRGPA